jgi:SAM-dependent methyltransferase
MATSQERGGLHPSQYHSSGSEQARISDLMALLPSGLKQVLDVGAREGYISRRLADHAQRVTAMDLLRPQVDHPRIDCVQGDATRMPFADSCFDLVFCAQVLEHIPRPALEQACSEIARVARSQVLIGVPYRQDIRWGRTTCAACNGISPPWAHVNSFDDTALLALFPGFRVQQRSTVGSAEPGTNALSTTLMDWAGNPYGTYVQDEGCVHCGAELQAPGRRNLRQRMLSKTATTLRAVLNLTRKPHANWLHLLMTKTS